MQREKINFGIIGLGLMGREFASAAARWCHLLDDGPIPVVKGICSQSKDKWNWYKENFPEIEIASQDFNDLLESDKIDAIYCAVPHHLYEEIYIKIIKSGKHLLAEKPFGIDKKANNAILKALENHPGQLTRCSSEFPYYPGAQRLISWIKKGYYGGLIEVKSGFYHSSDMDLSKAINWKRMVEFNGEYGCMGDLGFHTHHIPLRMNWIPKTVFANLQNIATYSPDNKGNSVECETWDNATLLCEADDTNDRSSFTLIFETKRMMPGATNSWYLKVSGTKAARFTTHNPRSFYSLVVDGKEQGWKRIDIGADSQTILH